ncbi:MAG: class I SAM-dependent methyltransferase [Nitrospirae bacterium]|nr:class I SAM-dependent methyltransferase [Nitrospirota bacterium]
MGKMSENTLQCRICRSYLVEEIGTVGVKPISVTSDSKLIEKESVVFICGQCGHIQKFHDAQTAGIIADNYSSYDIYHLSNGSEQVVFPTDSSSKTRTQLVFEKIIGYIPERGNLLDIGSGNGAVLKTASQMLGGWKLFSYDVVDRFKEEILKITNVISFSSTSLETIPFAEYDLITLWHSLEHMESPLDTFERLQRYFHDSTNILIQVPDVIRNPFDLAIIDHVSHFSKDSLLGLLSAKGFIMVLDGSEWVHNCATLFLKYEGSGWCPGLTRDVGPIKLELSDTLLWIRRVLLEMDDLIRGRKFGIFGMGLSSL